MQELVSENARKQLSELFGKIDLRILIIEDHEIMARGIRDFLQDGFVQKTASIRILKDEEFEKIDTIIETFTPQLMVIDSSLKKWKKHPIHGNSGVSIVAAVKRKFPEIAMICISTNPDNRDSALTNGAFLQTTKGDLPKVLKKCR